MMALSYDFGIQMDAARTRKRGSATTADLLAIPEDRRYHELIGGEIVPKASPSAEHGTAQRRIGEIVGPFDRRPGSRWPGGWWLMTEVEVEFQSDETYRPDVVGWRRDRVSERPRGNPVTIRPDWICEILSPTNSGNDRVTKLNAYHQFEVPHYWIVDPAEETLSAFRWTLDGYLLVRAAATGQRVRVEPFEAVEIDVGEIFGHDASEP
jgi:Uma2 family endonuclease